MGTIKLTKKEEEWIKDLKKLMRKRPKNLILFASCETKDGRMDKNRVVDSILFACEGGAF